MSIGRDLGQGRRRWAAPVLVVIGVAGLLAACGSSGGSAKTTGGGTNSSTTSGAASGSGASSSEFCAAAKQQIDDLPKQLQSLLSSSGQSTAWLAYADLAERNNQTLGRLAPAEIKGDYSTLAKAPAAIIKAIRDAHGDLSAIRSSLPTALAAARGADAVAASGRWTAYLKTHCGLAIPGT